MKERKEGPFSINQSIKFISGRNVHRTQVKE